MKPIILQGHSRPIRDIKFSREGDILLTGSVDRLITLWATESGERIGTFTHAAAVSHFSLTDDSKYIVSGDTLGNIYLWDLHTGEKIKEFTGDIQNTIKNTDLSYGNQKVLVVKAGREKNSKSHIETYDFETLKKTNNSKELSAVVESKHHSETGKFKMAKFTDIDRKLICSKDDGYIELFNIKSKNVEISKQVHKGDILDLDLSSKHEIALTSSADGTACTINTENFDVINTYKPENPTRLLNSGKISPLFSLDDENEAKYHAILAGGQESSKVTTTHANEGGFEILFYNLMYGEEFGCVLGHFGPVNVVAFSGNGKAFCSGGEDTSVRLHHLNEDYFNLK